MVRRQAGCADNTRGIANRVPTNFADRWTGVFDGCSTCGDNRDSLGQPRGDPRLQPFINDQRLSNHGGEEVAKLTEVPVHLNQHPLRVDRDEHSASRSKPDQAFQSPADRRRQEVARHLGVVGLNEESPIELRIPPLGQSGSLLVAAEARVGRSGRVPCGRESPAQSGSPLLSGAGSTGQGPRGRAQHGPSHLGAEN